MLKRVLAWVLLVGFVLLLLNIMTYQYLLAPSILVYVLIVIWFIFTNKPLPSLKKKKVSENKLEEKSEE
ncbi:MAG TPA: hypothetical protein VIK78_10430 [Ruminiclostridium sp.]